MSNAVNNAILAQMSATKYQPSVPGSPTYIGAVDYPETVYQGYIGSTNYTYEPRATGYGIIDASNIPYPVARMPKTSEFKELNLRTIISPLFGECSIPSFFQTSEDSIRSCNKKFGIFLFYVALTINSTTLLALYKRITSRFMIYFIVVHMLLYYILTRTFVNVSINEWRTVQKYKYMIKKEIDSSIQDSLIKKFNSITEYMNNQAITRTHVLELILIVSFLCIWIPLVFIKERS
jgi:hypothetical protein